jgi:hypothetical protein
MAQLSTYPDGPLEVGARRAILGQFCPDMSTRGGAAMAVSTIFFEGYEGRVKDYLSFSGYHTSIGLRAFVSLNTVADGSTAEPTVTDRIELRFGADQDGLVGSLTDSGNPMSFDVRLPWEWFDTFWRAISGESCSVSISWNKDREVFDFGMRVNEGFEGVADKERRERIDAMRREGN